jgi:transposase
LADIASRRIPQPDAVFRCEYLPPYGPDLNPIERVWKLTLRLCVHNRFFPDLIDIVGPVESEFLLWIKESNGLPKICATLNSCISAIIYGAQYN